MTDPAIMRVVLVGPSPDGRGGISSVIRWFEGSLRSHGLDVAVLATHGGRSQRQFAGRVESIWRTAVVCTRVIVTRPDVVHLFVGPRGSLLRKSLVMLAAVMAGSATIAHFHSGEIDRMLLGERSGKWSKFLGYLVSRADVVAVLWDGPLGSPLRRPGREWVTLGNPVSPCSETIGFDTRSHDVGFVGRITHDKGAATLVAVLSLLGDTPPPRRTVVLGEPGDAEGDRAVSELSAQADVLLMGWADPTVVRRTLADCRVVILPSVRDSLPMALLEAATCGCAVVGTSVGAMTELLGGGRGWLVDSSEPSNWVAAIEEALEHNVADRRAALLKEYVLEHYAESVVLESAVAAYGVAVKERDRRRA
jgi:glycosyltransferase involved in cell wall biosynthesis